jgi:acyl carrier protein
MPEARLALPTEDMVAAEIIRGLTDQFAESGTLPSSPLTPQTRLFEDLALDSLTLMGLVVNLEDHYRVILDETDATGIRTIADLAALVVRRIAEQS